MKKPTLDQAISMLIVALIINTIYVSCRKPEHDWTETSHTVTKGETLWTIAEQYCPEDMDVRDYIYEIKKLNNMDTDSIYEWQTLILLTLQKDIIDMYDVVNIEQSDNGYLITLEDGNGYYWERGMN